MAQTLEKLFLTKIASMPKEETEVASTNTQVGAILNHAVGCKTQM